MRKLAGKVPSSFSKVAFTSVELQTTSGVSLFMAVLTPLRTHTTAHPATVLSNDRFFTVHKVPGQGYCTVTRCAPKSGWGGGDGLHPPKPNLKNRLCRNSKIKGFTWSTVQPKWATETGWSLVNWMMMIIIIITAIELSIGGSSPYTSTDNRNKNKYT